MRELETPFLFLLRVSHLFRNGERLHFLQDKELQSCNRVFIVACFQNQFQKQLYKSQLIAWACNSADFLGALTLTLWQWYGKSRAA